MRMQKLYGIALVAILALGIAGCGLFDSRDPVGPVGSIADSAQLANFWVKDGPGGKYEVALEDNELEVSVPEAGQYMLTYTSTYGTFHIVFEALDAATLVIGLQPGDTVSIAYIEEGIIVNAEDLPVAVQADNVIVYLLPGPEDDGEDNDEDADAAVDAADGDDEEPSWYDMFDSDFVLVILIWGGDIVLEDIEVDEDDGEVSEDGEGPPWKVSVSAEGSGSVKPDGEKMVPDGASISIQFLPDSGNFADISVKIITFDELGEEVEEDFTPYLQQLGGKPGKQKGHLVIHDVDRDLEVVANFSGEAAEGGKPEK